MSFVTVTFSPTGTQERPGQLLVTYYLESQPEAAPETLRVDLTGRGFVPRLRVLPVELDFGQQSIEATSPVRTLTLTASADIAAVKVTNIVASGDFAVAPSTCQIERAASCAISVTFTPKHIGESTGALTMASDSGSSPKAIALTGEGVVHGGNKWKFPSIGWFESMLPVLLIVFLYLIGLTLIRWHMVAQPGRRLLAGKIKAVQAHLTILKLSPTAPNIAPITQLLNSASRMLGPPHDDDAFIKTAESDQPAKMGVWTRLANVVFWSRGEEHAGWRLVHEAQERIVALLPAENLRALLTETELELRELACTHATALADQLRDAIVAVPALPIEGCKAMLQEVQGFLHPQSASLAERINQALDPGSALTVEKCQTLAGESANQLALRSTALSDKIGELLHATAPTAEQLRSLLEESAGLLTSQATTLADELTHGLTTTPAISVEQWKPLLEKVRAYLLPQPASLANRITQILGTEPAVPEERWKALLAEALNYLYDRRDTSYATLSDWQNRTAWLVGCGLLLIVSLAAVLQHGVLFLVGATGGLLSRLTRSLYRQDLPTDYGASWTSLFLSPVVGALAGWSGILLVILGGNLNLLGPALKVDFCYPSHPMALSIAFLLGFSERAFNGILSQLEEKLQSRSAAAPAASPSMTPSTATPQTTDRPIIAPPPPTAATSQPADKATVPPVSPSPTTPQTPDKPLTPAVGK